MTIADHLARLSPQTTLDLSDGATSASPAALVPSTPPTHAELVECALANECVRAFIAQRLMTWSEARVRDNPPLYLVYEHGAVVGNLTDIPGMARHAEKRKGMGRRLGIRALQPDDPVPPYNLGLLWGPTHPRRFRYEQRMALKRLLSRRDRVAVGRAMRQKRSEFRAWARAQPGLEARIADTTGLSLNAFWRAVRGRAQAPGSAEEPRDG